MKLTKIIGMDISKYSFELWGVDERGNHTLHKRLHRDKVVTKSLSSLLIIHTVPLRLNPAQALSTGRASSENSDTSCYSSPPSM